MTKLRNRCTPAQRDLLRQMSDIVRLVLHWHDGRLPAGLPDQPPYPWPEVSPTRLILEGADLEVNDLNLSVAAAATDRLAVPTTSRPALVGLHYVRHPTLKNRRRRAGITLLRPLSETQATCYAAGLDLVRFNLWPVTDRETPEDRHEREELGRALAARYADTQRDAGLHWTGVANA